MASLRWFLFLFLLLVTMWSNLFLSLRSIGCLCSYQSLSMYMEESEYESLLEESLPDYLRFLEALYLIFLIFFSSRHNTDFLEMLHSILFWFWIDFKYSLHLCSEFLYLLTASAMLTRALNSLLLMDCWSELLRKSFQSYATCTFAQ